MGVVQVQRYRAAIGERLGCGRESGSAQRDTGGSTYHAGREEVDDFRANAEKLVGSAQKQPTQRA